MNHSNPTPNENHGALSYRKPTMRLTPTDSDFNFFAGPRTTADIYEQTAEMVVCFGYSIAIFPALLCIATFLKAAVG